MRNVVFDIETNGLYEAVTKIHCLVIMDLDSDEVLSCADQPGYRPISEGLAVLEKAERCYGHNIIRYDIPVLRKLTGLRIPIAKARDTLVIAGMRWCHNLKDIDHTLFRKGKIPADKFKFGSNSLKAWGYRLGVHKGDFADHNTWEHWTPEMQTYCERDVLVTKLLVQKIRSVGGCPPEAIETEQELAEYLWYQEMNGCPFDMDKAGELLAALSARREALAVELRAIFGSWYGRNGKPKIAKRGNKKRGLIEGAEYQNIKRIQFNPGSRQHIALRLQKVYGWKPEKDAYGSDGWPTVDEKVLAGLDQSKPGIKLLTEYLMVVKRLGQLSEGKEAWLKHVKKDPRTGLQHVYGHVNQSGTTSHRASHSHPNLAQVPAVGKPYGAECRGLFYAPEGFVLIGADASSLEARCLGHYMAEFDGGKYGHFLLTGDVHTTNQGILGLLGKPEGRKVAKQWKYAFDYGAGDEKLGRIHSPHLKPKEQKALGAKLRRQFLKQVPAMKRTIDSLKNAKTNKEHGYLITLDGRRVYVRSQHAILNTCLQCAGAIICKRWIVNFNRRLVAEFGEQGWEGKWAALLWVHDEVQIAVRPEIAERVKQILIEEIRALTNHFNWRVPLDGEAKQGRTWADTH